MTKKFLKKATCLLAATLLIASSTIMTGCKSDISPAATWQVNNFAPTAETPGNVGDMWLNTATCDIYQLTADGWVLCGNTKAEDGKDGNDGVHGTNGKDGVDGTAWFTGEGYPSTTVSGKVGDMYFDTVNFKIYKMNSAGAWEYLVTLG